MSTYKRGDIYWYKFMWRGEIVRESTRQGNDKIARNMESAHRTALAKGEVGIREKQRAPVLREFLKGEFQRYAETRHASKPMTLRYYKQGSDMLMRSSLAGLRLDELTDKHAQEFARQHASLSPSGINRGRRTLRRALNLAYQWGKLEKPVRVTLAAGEKQRDRVLTQEESAVYLKACPQPWKDCATIILDEGFRPGEVFTLQWPNIFFSENETGLIQILQGKSKAARRILPMTPRVYELLKARHNACGRPTEGWVFPRLSSKWKFKTGKARRFEHFSGDAAKEQHKKALADSGVEPFEFVPYTLRHTALTNLGEAAGGDVFVLARIAGHSTITVTQRYIHPQAAAINRVFAASQSLVGTKLGTPKKLPKGESTEQSVQRLEVNH